MTIEEPKQPRLYDELASWWSIFSPPADYEEEAAFFTRLLLEAGEPPARTVLELGSGGGNNASHLKKTFQMTLVDPAPGMLAVSRTINPECEHLEGDMRTLRLGRLFDRVFIHDAINYMTTREDLRRAMETACVHCRPGGAAIFVPDFVREKFRPATNHGGYDGEGRAIRYLEWIWDPDPSDTTYTVDYAYLIREAGGEVRVEHDRHVLGLFSQDEWLELLKETGFEPRVVPFEHSDLEPGMHVVFVAVKPRS